MVQLQSLLFYCTEIAASNLALTIIGIQLQMLKVISYNLSSILSLNLLIKNTYHQSLQNTWT